MNGRMFKGQTCGLRDLLGIIVLLLLGVGVAQAQQPTATILGQVKDSSGAVVPGVQLTVRNEETGQTRAVVAASDGSYRFSALPVGSYEIRVAQAGFRSEIRRGLELTVMQEAVVNFTLEVGAIEQSVEVTAEAPLVNTTSGSLGGLVDERKVAELPLNGRNYATLSLLQLGVQEVRNISRSSAVQGTWFSSSGAPPRSNNYLLDGAIMVTVLGGSTASTGGNTLGLEGIREWRVITNFFSAEYGLTMGSQMLIVSKSGTNTFHGSLFEYFRNSALDARNFFDRKTATDPRRLPPFTRNNFGGSFGGPIKKDKTHFFAVYEGLRERLGITRVLNVIPPSAKVDGGLVPQIAPLIRPLLALYPVPNLPNNEFAWYFNQPVREDYGQIRVDHAFSASDTFFARYTVQDTEGVTPIEYPQFKTIRQGRLQFGTLSETHIFSPNLLNILRFSWSRTTAFRDSPSGISGPQFSFIEGKDIGSISIGGVTALGSGSPSDQTQNISTGGNDLVYSRSRHTLKMGIHYNRYRNYFQHSVSSRGTLTFADLRSFLLAQASTFVAITPGSNTARTWEYSTLGLYLHDDLRVKSNLTLNLGLRYEFNTQYEETKGLGSALRDPLRDATFTLGPPWENSSLKNLSPRVGFAWDVKGNGQTAVRGGFGLLYDIGNMGAALINPSYAQPPFSSQSTLVRPPTLTFPVVFPPESAGKTIGSVEYSLQQPHLLQYNLTIEQQLPFAMGLTLSYAGSRGLNLMTTREGNPTVPQILPDSRQFWTGNEPRMNPNWGSFRMHTAASNSWYNALQIGLAKRLSKGFQFQSSYTWAKAIDEKQSVLGGDTIVESSITSDPSNRKVDRGLANFDTAHNWRFNAIYQLPEFPRQGALGKVVNGWRMSGILSLQTGYPFTPALQTQRSRSQVGGGGAGLDRPDLLVGRSNDNIILGRPNRYFDPNAFAVPPAGFLGTAGRNILRMPGFANLDFSLAKDTALRFLGESGKLEFRAEFFNILNRVNFGLPNRIVFAARSDVEAPLATAGRITDTANTSRQIQLALKIAF